MFICSVPDELTFDHSQITKWPFGILTKQRCSVWRWLELQRWERNVKRGDSGVRTLLWLHIPSSPWEGDLIVTLFPQLFRTPSTTLSVSFTYPYLSFPALEDQLFWNSRLIHHIMYISSLLVSSRLLWHLFTFSLSWLMPLPSVQELDQFFSPTSDSDLVATISLALHNQATWKCNLYSPFQLLTYQPLYLTWLLWLPLHWKCSWQGYWWSRKH